ncbi:MAG: LuxR family transcriptional regulator [Solirubrobacteraceae bacterium]|nr:LuxR family transcriptional regulator [Solirubrobacteraceae bacterium]
MAQPAAYARAVSGPAIGEGWESLFWTLFRQSSNPITLLDESRRFIEINDAALRTLGYTRGALMGRSITEVIWPTERAEATRRWHRFLREGQYHGTRLFRHADGTKIELEFAAQLAVIGGRRLAVYVIGIPSPLAPDDSSKTAEEALTPREREVVTSIAMGQATAEIARSLQIAPETVRTHVRNAMTKMGARTRAQLVALALCGNQAITLPHTG